MPNIAYQEYRDRNAKITYPFTDKATFTDKYANITIPIDLIIDASLFIPGELGVVFISEIDINETSTYFKIDSEGASLSVSGKLNRTDGTVPLYDEYKRRVGTLVCNLNKIVYLSSIPTGVYKFFKEGLPFVPHCVLPVKTAGLTAINIEGSSSYLTGDVWLVGCNGVVLRKESTESGDNIIRVDVVGDPLYKYANRDNDHATPPRMLRSINGIEPDEYGNIGLTTVGESVLRVKTNQEGITIYIAGTYDD